MSRILGNRFLLDKDSLLGPSPRYVIWFHGCNRNCPGCIAIDWNRKKVPEFDLSVQTIVQTIKGGFFVEGITISGGEPFLQVDALLELSKELSNEGLGIIVYTGYELSELIDMQNSKINEILATIDVLVDGRYIAVLDDDKPFRGSANQIIHQFTNRYKDYFARSKKRNSRIETKDGQELLTGIPDTKAKIKWDKTKELDGFNV